MENIFAPKAGRVLRVILTNRNKEWLIYKLAEEARVGYGHVHRLVKILTKMGFCRKTEDSKIALQNPAELLTRWANYYNFFITNKINSYHSEEKIPEKFLKKIKKVKLNYALTLHAGANLIAPYVRPKDTYFYINPEDKQEWIRELNLELIEFGGNIHLVEPYDEGVFYAVQKVGGLAVVSDIQLYLDLYNYPARGREAAEHLFEKIIKNWQP